MSRSRLLLAAAVTAGAAAVSGCSTYDSYGYSGVSVGLNYGSPYYGSPYYGGGYGYQTPYYRGGYVTSPYAGWYSNYYYPGTGVYVYDRNRRGYRWNNQQRNYWQQRRVQRRHRR